MFLMQVHIFNDHLNRILKIHVGLTKISYRYWRLPVLIEDNDINPVDCPFKMKNSFPICVCVFPYKLFQRLQLVYSTISVYSCNVAI